MVEVLISMAIVSMILGGAYVTSNKSTLAIRDAQEHVDALKLASAEVELLKSLSPSPIGANNHLCYTLDGTPYTYTTDNSACILTSTGDKASAGTMPAYNVNIMDDSGAPDTFHVNVSWGTITGSIANVDMYYRTN